MNTNVHPLRPSDPPEDYDPDRFVYEATGPDDEEDEDEETDDDRAVEDETDEADDEAA